MWVQSQREMSKHDLAMIFSHFGHLERVDVPRPHSGRVPFAFVHFQQEADAKSTIRRANDGEFGSLTVKPYQCRRDARQPVQRSNDNERPVTHELGRFSVTLVQHSAEAAGRLDAFH